VSLLILDNSVALALAAYLRSRGVEFIDENGGGPGVRLRKPVRGKSGK